MDSGETKGKNAKMNLTAKYLDSGFYTVSDKAASELCKATGHDLPRFGYERFVMLNVDGIKLNAWLQRTSNRFREDSPSRGWSWALYAFRPDGGSQFDCPALGKAFTFTPHSLTLATA